MTVLPYDNTAPADLLRSLRELYAGKSVDKGSGYRQLPSSVVRIPVDKKLVLKRGLVAARDTADIVDNIMIDLGNSSSYRSKGYLGLGEILMLDIIATNAARGWNRPIYWCSTVGDEYHVGLTDYLRSTGMTHQLVPPSFDETARRMLFSVRNSMVETSSQLLYDGDRLKAEGNASGAARKYKEAIEILDMMMERTPQRVGRLDMYLGMTTAQIYCEIGKEIGDRKLTAKGLKVFEDLMRNYAQYLSYNAMISAIYYSPSLTYDSKLSPYQYYRMVELYEEYGGSKDTANGIIATTGFTRDQLKRQYELYKKSDSLDSASAAGDDLSASDAAGELSKYCEIANHLSGLSEADYAAATADERYIDSMLYSLLEEFEKEPETLRMLKEDPRWQSLDRERSKRLNEEFCRRHPDLFR